MNVSSETRVLASYAVFREISNDRSMNLVSVINLFIVNILQEFPMQSFTSSDVKKKMNNIYGFNIPISVLEKCLKKIEVVRKEYGLYYTNQTLKIDSHLSEMIVDNEISNESIIAGLIEYTAHQIQDQIDNEKMINEFTLFLLNDTNSSRGLYTKYISAYLLVNQKDSTFLSKINKIKEGAILLAGLNFNSNISPRKNWNHPLTLFLENEEIFHICGLNGVFYQEIAEDALNLVKELNESQNQKKDVIKLKYFTEVGNEIDSYFQSAENVFNGNGVANTDAMREILNDCSSLADIRDKKTKLFHTLSKWKIELEEPPKLYVEDNYMFNIEGKEIYDDFKLENSKDIKKLNYVSALRNGNSEKDIARSQYVLLTEKTSIIEMAYALYNRDVSSSPFALSISMLSNRLWFDLNKGFGSNYLPKSLNTISKARIILASLVQKSISNSYENIKKEYDDGKITKECMVDCIIEYRECSKKPDDIDESNIDAVLDIISEHELVAPATTREMLKEKVKASESEKESLKIEVDLYKEIKEKNDETIENLRDHIIITNRKTRNKVMKIQKNSKIFINLLNNNLSVYFLIFCIIF